MRIAADGNVGIGTTSPNSELHIASLNPVLTLQDTNSPTPTGTKIEFTDSTNNVHAEIGLTAGTSGALNIKNNYQPIDFYTGTLGTSTLAMQIDDNGFVGIGITNPTATLHVNGGLRVATVTEATTYSADKFLVSDAENVKYVDAVQLASLVNPYITSGGKFVDGTDTNDAVYTTGNVGIGTTDPDTLLEIASGDSGGDAALGSPTFRINNTTESGDWDVDDVVGSIEYYSSDTSGNAPYVTSFIKSVNETNGTLPSGALTFGTATYNAAGGAIERLRITDDGDVGIGTTSPSLSYGGKGLQIQNTDTAGLRLTDTTGSDFDISVRSGDVLLFEGEGNPIRIGVGGSEKMRIQNDGNVGIGVTSPTQKLHVSGNVLITAALLSNQENTDVDTGTETVANVAIATYTAAFFDFVIKNGTNVRSGTVYACHDGTSVVFTETSTNDLGDTSDVTLSVDISGGNMRLLATTTSDDWSVKSLIRAI
jgi:hypothetical protein